MVGILASILVIVSLFIAWVTVNIPLIDASDAYTGLQIYDLENFDYNLFPIVVAILGALSVLVFLFNNKKNADVSALIGIVLGLGVVVLSYMTYDKLTESAVSFGTYDLITIDMSFGLVAALIGGVLIIITSLMDR